MKKYLLAAALAGAACTPATAGKPAPPPSPACIGNFCLVNPDADDEKMFIVKSGDKDSTEVFGSLIKNNSDHQIDITASTLFTTGNGFANIKPAKNTLLEAMTFTPEKGIDLDGAFFSVQLQDNFSCKGKDCAPDTADPSFFLTVNGGETTQATFKYSQAFNGNDHDNGFDEAIEGLPGTRIDSVSIFIDTALNPYVWFKEIKQVTWSPCDDSTMCGSVVINPTGGAPEPSTWAMLLTGFGLMAYGALRRGRSGAGATAIS